MAATVYRNRELSWLQFNERVLAEAEREDVPLCERLSFVSIFQSNLDEFFMVRVGSLIDQRSLDESYRENKTHMTAQEQLDAILPRVQELNRRKDEIYQHLMTRLEEAGVRLVNFRRISAQESAHLEKYFDSEIAPLLSPVIVDKRQPFPFIKSREIFAAAVLEKKSGKTRLGLIPCGTGVFPRLIQVSDGVRKAYMLSEELILHFIPKVFKGYAVREKSLLRATRNADIDADALYDEDLDYREFMADLMKRRKRLAPLRLEMSRKLGDDMVTALCKHLDVSKRSVFRYNCPLDLSFLFQLQDVLRQRTELFYPKRFPQRSAQFAQNRPVLDQIRAQDKLLAYPFESMKPFLTMLREAASDEKVVSIKMTLYRVAKQSEVVEALCEAAENGKDVLVLVELKARFDEENNIEWSRRLEHAGCNVIYGLNGYKVHSKLCLITRKDGEQVEYFTQIGTGNYNEKTARLYTDLSMMTHRPEIGLEASAVFQALAMGEMVQTSQELLVAPHCLQNRVLDMMDEEIARAQQGLDAWIGIKINSLTDKRIIDKLIAASQAGVQIDLIVRGICCLLPGVPGMTENIRIISIVGRFLEHSRIYMFGKGERQKLYIASADLMTRNTLRRVEVGAPVVDPALRRELNDLFDLMLRDNIQARELHSDGSYVRRTPGESETVINAQELLYQQAYDRIADSK